MLAVRLAKAGLDVLCVARADTAEAIRAEGLTLKHGGETITARPRATERLTNPVELLLVTVKAPALDEALDRIALSPGTVLPLMNGLEHVDRIRARLDCEVVAGSIGRLEAYRETPTVVVQATPVPLVTLAAEDGAAGPLRLAGLDVRVAESEQHVLWEKLARLAPLAAATTISQRRLGELRSDPDWRETMEAAVTEACRVAAADGVSLSEAAQWEILDAMPATATTSTARDAAEGRPTELDAILGAVVRAAARNGIAVPTLETLLAETEEACRAPSR